MGTMHEPAPEAQRYVMRPTTLERYLIELSNVDMPFQTFYLEPGEHLKSFSAIIPGLRSTPALSPILSAINGGDVGASIFLEYSET